jgi:hypothetical protein
LIIANFDVTKNVTTGFPHTGTWYDLMDNTTINVSNVTAPITLAAGGYKIYGNKAAC